MKHLASASLCLALVSLLALPAQAEEPKPVVAQPGPMTIAVPLTSANGKDAGDAYITEAAHGLIVRIEARGLAPGWHGVHFHGTGDCSDHGDHFKKSGGHAAKDDEKHGFMTDEGPHAGDLPNMWAASDGSGRAEFYTATIGLDMLQDKDGGALMIHAGPDDFRTDPSGNSGDRIACGVIPAMKEE